MPMSLRSTAMLPSIIGAKEALHRCTWIPRATTVLSQDAASATRKRTARSETIARYRCFVCVSALRCEYMSIASISYGLSTLPLSRADANHNKSCSADCAYDSPEGGSYNIALPQGSNSSVPSASLRMLQVCEAADQRTFFGISVHGRSCSTTPHASTRGCHDCATTAQVCAVESMRQPSTLL